MVLIQLSVGVGVTITPKRQRCGGARVVVVVALVMSFALVRFAKTNKVWHQTLCYSILST